MNEFTYRIIPTAFDFEMTLLPAHPNQAKVKTFDREIETLWREELNKPEQLLFDGKILSADSYETNGLKGCFVSYKQYLAWNRLPDIRKQLEIHPVGIMGLTCCGQKLLLGKRSTKMAHWPEKYECAPSGGVDANYVQQDKILFRELLLNELQEETGIEPSEIEWVEPFALVERKNACCSAVEIIVRVQVKESVLSKGKRLKPTEEYSELLWLEPKELKQLVALKKDEFLATTLLVVEQFFQGLPNLLNE